MGGESKQTQTQSSTTNPWAPAQPVLNSILGKLQGQVDSSGLSSTASGAIDQLQQSANAGNPYTGQITDLAKSLLSGGGATGQSGAVTDNLKSFSDRFGSFADPNYSSLNSPELRAALDQIQTDVTGQTRGMFAAGGRSFSPSEAGAIARNVTSAQAPLILDQFNKDQAIRTDAAKSLYDAGNTSAGLQTGMTQQDIANRLQGVTTSNDAMAAKDYGAQRTLDLETLKQQLPAQTLGLLAQIGIPIAGLGGQSSGTATGTNQMSGAQQFGTIAQGIGNIGKFLWG